MIKKIPAQNVRGSAYRLKLFQFSYSIFVPELAQGVKPRL